MAQRRNRKSTRTVDRSQGVYIPLRKVPLGEGIYTDPEQRRLMSEWLNKMEKDIDRTPLWCYERYKRVFGR